MRRYGICDILKLCQGHISTDRHFLYISINPAHLTLFKAEQNQVLSSPYLPSCTVLIIYTLICIRLTFTMLEGHCEALATVTFFQSVKMKSILGNLLLL